MYVLCFFCEEESYAATDFGIQVIHNVDYACSKELDGMTRRREKRIRPMNLAAQSFRALAKMSRFVTRRNKRDMFI